MNDISRIEKFLNIIKEEAKDKPYLSKNFVYQKLTRLGTSYVSGINREYFDGWIEHFNNSENIKVYMTSKEASFCHFDSMVQPDNEDKTFKMYIPMKPDMIDENAKVLFTYLTEKGIIHSSKISVDIRYDDLVIRLYDINDVKLISEFIMNNEIFKNSLLEQNDILPNPFTYHDDMFSYTIDGKESYNTILATYITMYISELKANNKLDEVSYLGFLNYVKEIYKMVFVSGEDLNKYLIQMKIFDDVKNSLIDHEVATSMLLLALSSKDRSFVEFSNHYKEMTSDERRNMIANKIDSLLNKRKEDKLSDTIEFEKIDFRGNKR